MQRLCDGPSALLLGCPDWRQVWCRAAALGRPLVAALGVAGVQSYFLLSRCYSSGYIRPHLEMVPSRHLDVPWPKVVLVVVPWGGAGGKG